MWRSHYTSGVIRGCHTPLSKLIKCANSKICPIFRKNSITATPCLTKCAASLSPSFVINCVWLFSLSWFAGKKRKYFWYFPRGASVTTRRKKFNHGWRRFGYNFLINCVQVMQGFQIKIAKKNYLSGGSIIGGRPFRKPLLFSPEDRNRPASCQYKCHNHRLF